jgi:HEAT repeat protein
VALTGPGEKPAPSGSAAPQANVAALLVTLRSEKADDRRTAATALARLGDQARAAVPALVAAFPQEKDTFARRAMVVALGQIGPGARDAVPSLVVALRDGYSSADDLVGFEASVALAKIDPDGAVTAQLLTAMLRDKNDDVRRRAAGVLRMVGPVLKNAVPVLIEAAKDRHSEVRAEAVRSLAALRPDPGLAVPVLATAVRDSDKYVRQYAATALATFGAEAKGALKALIEAVAAEKDPEARAQEIRALRYMGPAAAEAIPVLTEALKDPSKDVRAQAEKALKRIRPEPPKPAAPAKPGA